MLPEIRHCLVSGYPTKTHSIVNSRDYVLREEAGIAVVQVIRPVTPDNRERLTGRHTAGRFQRKWRQVCPHQVLLPAESFNRLHEANSATGWLFHHVLVFSDRK